MVYGSRPQRLDCPNMDVASAFDP
eukprot:COSAG02_NODE_64901_length_259_cov_0.650000_1_plen_23_part_10